MLLLLFVHRLMMMTTSVINWLGVSACCLQLWIFFRLICVWPQLHNGFQLPWLPLRSDLTIWLDWKQDFPKFWQEFPGPSVMSSGYLWITYLVYLNLFGRHSLLMPETCPAHLTCTLFSKVCLLGIPKHNKTSMLGILSCHLILSSL